MDSIGPVRPGETLVNDVVLIVDNIDVAACATTHFVGTNSPVQNVIKVAAVQDIRRIRPGQVQLHHARRCVGAHVVDDHGVCAGRLLDLQGSMASETSM